MQYTTTNEVSITKDEGAYVLGLMEQNKKLKDKCDKYKDELKFYIDENKTLKKEIKKLKKKNIDEYHKFTDYATNLERENKALESQLQEWIEGYEKLQRQN